MNFEFNSGNHIRYEKGKRVSGPHSEGANRVIKVEPNIYGGEGLSVTIYNIDGNNPFSRDNIQMTPKQMKINQRSNEKVVLTGYGKDIMGGSFADYGLTIYFENGEVNRCILHMHDRNIDIEYIKHEILKTHIEPEIISLAKRANVQYQQEQVTDGYQLLIQIYRTVKSDPSQLRSVKDFSSLGTSFLLMLDQKISDDIDTLQMIASVCYLCISKAILNDSNNINFYKDRLLMLQIAHEPFSYTVISALNINSNPLSFMGSMASISARDEIFKMEIADLELHPYLHRNIPFFKNRKDELDEMIENDFFLPEKTLENIIKSGVENHEKLLNYLENRILIEEDVDF